MTRRRTAAPLLAALLLAGCAPGPRPPAAGPAAALPDQGVRGRLTHRGAPVAGAIVFAYRRASPSFLGPADFASAPSGPDGSYAIDLVEGAYHLVARRRASGSDAGPLAPGDLQRIHPGNPATVLPGRLTVVDLDLEEMRDLMVSRAGPRGPTGTGIRGRITDAAGRPQAWVFAFAHATPDARRVPDFTSSMTADDGRYVIHLPRGGRWYVGARTHIREKPAAGEPYGLFEGSPDHGVEVPEGGYVEGVDVVLRPFGGGP